MAVRYTQSLSMAVLLLLYKCVDVVGAIMLRRID